MLVHHRVPSVKWLLILLLPLDWLLVHHHSIPSMKQLGVLLLPLDGMLVHHRVPNMKQLGVLLLPLDGMLVNRRTPSIKWLGALCEERHCAVKCKVTTWRQRPGSNQRPPDRKSKGLTTNLISRALDPFGLGQGSSPVETRSLCWPNAREIWEGYWLTTGPCHRASTINTRINLPRKQYSKSNLAQETYLEVECSWSVFAGAV